MKQSSRRILDPGNCREDQPDFFSLRNVYFAKYIFYVQPNKLRPILKFEFWYPIEHIFAPACSSGRKIHYFSWSRGVLNLTMSILPSQLGCNFHSSSFFKAGVY